MPTPMPLEAYASDSGVSILDHINWLPGIDSACLGGRGSVAQCQPLAERFRRNGTWVAPTHFIALVLKALLRAGENPIVTHFGKEVVAKFWAGSLPQGNWLRGVVRAPSADSAGFLSIAARVGLPIVAATDASPGLPKKLLPGFTLHAELAVYVAEGLSPLDALRSATLNPAKLLRATDSLGTVAPGKLADLVLLDADPLADITNTTTIRAVVANGRYFDRAALDGVLAEARAEGAAWSGRASESGTDNP